MSSAYTAKRAKVSAVALTPTQGSVAAAAVAAAVTGEPAILRNIIGFIPASSSDKDGADAAAAQPALVLKTIAALCRAIPGLSRLVGPTNEAFWREMVLSQFNFETSGNTYNVDHRRGEWFEEDEVGVNDECDDLEYAAWHRHPKNGPHREWKREHRRASTAGGESNADRARGGDSDESDEEGWLRPHEFLVEGLAHWPALRTYFKRAAYGFLEKIQQDRSLMPALWPDHEGAFSLFCDLLLLPHFQSSGDCEWETWSDGDRPVYPCPMDACLMGHFPTQIVGRGFAMLKFCGFAPYFWTLAEEPVSGRWSGFGGPLPPIECKRNAQVQQTRATAEATGGMRQKCDCHKDEENEENEREGEDEDEDKDCQFDGRRAWEERSSEERLIFPGAESDHIYPFLHLRQFVHEKFSDWRRVHTSEVEVESPEFYIGSTKRSGRWMGFVGQSDYWNP